MKNKGITLLEIMIVIVIISILSAQLFPLIGQAKKRAKAVTDITNMRQLYAAVCMYESDSDDRSPAFLPLTAGYTGSVEVFKSILDPRKQNSTKQGWNSPPCAPPNTFDRSYYRISYPYLRSFKDDDESSYIVLRQDAKVGMLASPWVGDISQWMGNSYDDSEYGPVMRGAIFRTNMDGSLYVLPKRKFEDCLCACKEDLFSTSK